MRILNWLLDAASVPAVEPAPPPRHIGPRALRIAPPPRQAWDEKLWRRIREGRATHYLGAYRVRDRRGAWRLFDGRVIEDTSGIKAYVADPPVELRGHHKGPCFQLVTVPWFRVHWRRAPASVDDALLYVENILRECLNA
jgi:hypothetical protein